MKQYLILIGLLSTSLIYSCGKSSNPDPSNKGSGNTSGTGTGTGSGTGTGNGTGTGDITLKYDTINTNGAYENIDADTHAITNTLASNPSGQGVQTAAGGDVKVELTNIKDGDYTLKDSKVDELRLTFTTVADPILKYTTSTDVAIIHINRIPNSIGSFSLIGSKPMFDPKSYYKSDTIMALSKSATQYVQRFVLKKNN